MNIQTVFKGAVLLGVLVSAGGLRAEALVITSDVTNWEGLTLPDAGEEIIIKDGVTAKVTTRAALEAIKDCSRIRPETPTSRFYVDVPAGETWTNFCPMSAVNLADAGNIDCDKGEIYKTGEGTLCLQTVNHLKVGSGTLYDWWTGLTAAEGHLRLPKTESDGTHYIGYVTVSNGAAFHLVESGDTYARGIFGDGTITNDSATARKFFVMNMKSYNPDSHFYGAIGGAISEFHNQKNGSVYLYGTNSSVNAFMMICESVLGVRKIGNSGENSSVGRGDVFFRTDGEPTLRFLGTHDDAGKTLWLYQHASNRAFLDGGVYGGLNWTGSIKPRDAVAAMRALVFTGSNVNECVVSGPLEGNLYYEKEGSGTWRFTDHDKRLFSTGFAVREGVFAYDSLLEQGRLCSLGLATNLTASGGALPLAKVDYAFTLGTTKETDSPAVLAYTGTNGYTCTTRPLALVGRGGHFRNDTDHPIRFRGVSSLAEGDDVKELVLDGSGAGTNEVADVSDGAGVTGVTKDGTGTWRMSGDLTFTGPLSVKKGTLVIRKTEAGNYKWFRWTIQSHKTPESTTVQSYLAINAVGFFDENGTVQSGTVKYSGECGDVKPGQYCLATDCWHDNYKISEGKYGNDNNLFTMSQDYGLYATFYNPKTSDVTYPKKDKPDTWLSIVAHLPESAAKIRYFDFMNTWNANAYGRGVGNGGSSLEGSVDGLHWNMITNNITFTQPTASWTWTLSNTTGFGTHKAGVEIVDASTDKAYSVLTGDPAISVAPGAKLVADGDITIKNLTLDGEKGMGTLDGFAFDESGTINIVGDKAKFLDKAPADIRGATVGRVSNWAVSVNGTLKPGWKVAASSDGIKIIKSGMVLLFR